MRTIYGRRHPRETTSCPCLARPDLLPLKGPDSEYSVHLRGLSKIAVVGAFDRGSLYTASSTSIYNPKIKADKIDDANLVV